MPEVLTVSSADATASLSRLVTRLLTGDSTVAILTKDAKTAAQLYATLKLDTPVSVADYLEAHGFRAERVAIELNGEIIPRDKCADAMLDDQCVMEIVQFVQGG